MKTNELEEKYEKVLKKNNLFKLKSIDHVMFLQLMRNLTNDETNAEMQILVISGLKEDKIDSIAFVESPEKYRISK